MPLKHTPPPPSRPQIGVSADPPPANPPGWDSRARPSARPLGSGCTDTHAQPHAGPVFGYRRHAQACVQSDPFPVLGPPGTKLPLCARAARSPRPSPVMGEALWGRVLRHRPGSCASLGGRHYILLLPLLRVQASQAGPGPSRGSEGAGGAGHGVMAHQTGIHGEDGWRTDRGPRVSARGCGPSLAVGPLFPLPAPAWGSFLFSFAAAGRLGWSFLGGMRTYCA